MYASDQVATLTTRTRLTPTPTPQYVYHGLVSRLLSTARIQVMPRQFDVQALINGLGIDVVFFRSRSLREFDGLVLVPVGR